VLSCRVNMPLFRTRIAEKALRGIAEGEEMFDAPVRSSAISEVFCAERHPLACHWCFHVPQFVQQYVSVLLHRTQ
jgi:hypothetical protein